MDIQAHTRNIMRGSYINGDDKLVIKFVDRSIMNTSENLDNLKRLLPYVLALVS